MDQYFAYSRYTAQCFFDNLYFFSLLAFIKTFKHTIIGWVIMFKLQLENKYTFRQLGDNVKVLEDVMLRSYPWDCCL